MGFNIIDRVTPKGIRLKKEMEHLSRLEVRIGFQAGEAAEENGADMADVAAWNEFGTAHIPSRPFIRKSVDDNAGKINDFVEEQVGNLVDGATAEEILKMSGIFQKDLMQEKIESGDFTPNSPATIRKKKSSKPLIDTGRMRQSVNYQVQARGG